MNRGLGFPPMEPHPARDIPFSGDYLYQVKWDGVRVIAMASSDGVCLINKRGRVRTAQYPELQALPGSFPSDAFIVDGEVVVMQDSKPHFPGVMRRDNTADESRIGFLKNALPVNYIIFDLLQIDNENMLNLPLQIRLYKLRQLFTPDPKRRFHLIEDFADGAALFKCVKEAGLEGIVAKAIGSAYLPGKKHRHWYKIKCLQQIHCLVGGYILRQGQIRSLLLGVRQQEELICVGQAGSGLSEADRRQLGRELPHRQVDKSPFSQPVSLSGGGEIHYVDPVSQVLVEYLEWSPRLRLRQPVIKSLQ